MHSLSRFPGLVLDGLQGNVLRMLSRHCRWAICSAVWKAQLASVKDAVECLTCEQGCVRVVFFLLLTMLLWVNWQPHFWAVVQLLTSLTDSFDEENSKWLSSDVMKLAVKPQLCQSIVLFSIKLNPSVRTVWANWGHAVPTVLSGENDDDMQYQ